MKVIFFLLIFCVLKSVAQDKKTYQIKTLAFYNLENFFDTTNDSLIFDDERTPKGDYLWTKERYNKKIENLAQVISEIGLKVTKTSPDIIGLCEAENLDVLEDLINHQKLRSKGYGIIHYNSPDDRGIDVALLYKKNSYNPTSFKSHRLLLFDEDGKRDYTRDQLVVGGYMNNEEIYFIVNHWPSRRGGEEKSRPLRIKAAQLNKRIIDSLRYQNVTAKIITMGDFNDDPRNDSLKKVLKSKGKIKQLDSISLFNPMVKLYEKGLGTLAYRDKWNLFDQFLFTPNLISEHKTGYSYWKAGIYNPNYLKNTSGKYKGYPFRTYAGTTYLGGFSDHFPVYMYLIKQLD